jgi:hypothetical protein
VGDLYLTCVATAGLGMCRSLRAQFELCAKANQESSMQMLQELGREICSHVPEKEQLLCAADLINRQLMQGFMTKGSSSVSSDPLHTSQLN